MGARPIPTITQGKQASVSSTTKEEGGKGGFRKAQSEAGLAHYSENDLFRNPSPCTGKSQVDLTVVPRSVTMTGHTSYYKSLSIHLMACYSHDASQPYRTKICVSKQGYVPRTQLCSLQVMIDLDIVLLLFRKEFGSLEKSLCHRLSSCLTPNASDSPSCPFPPPSLPLSLPPPFFSSHVPFSSRLLPPFSNKIACSCETGCLEM